MNGEFICLCLRKDEKYKFGITAVTCCVVFFCFCFFVGMKQVEIKSSHVLLLIFKSMLLPLIETLFSLIFFVFGPLNFAACVSTLAASCPDLPWSEEMDLLHSMQLFLLLLTLQHNLSPYSL